MGGVMLGVLWGAATQSWFSYGYICAIAINTFYTAKKKKKKKKKELTKSRDLLLHTQDLWEIRQERPSI